MRVKYVKEGVSAKIGDIREHTPAQARVLIKLRIAVLHEEEQAEDAQPAKKRAYKRRAPKKGEVFGNLPKVSADNATTTPKKKASD